LDPPVIPLFLEHEIREYPGMQETVVVIELNVVSTRSNVSVILLNEKYNYLAGYTGSDCKRERLEVRTKYEEM
jgi:hypothetical protein